MPHGRSMLPRNRTFFCQGRLVLQYLIACGESITKQASRLLVRGPRLTPPCNVARVRCDIDALPVLLLGPVIIRRCPQIAGCACPSRGSQVVQTADAAAADTA